MQKIMSKTNETFGDHDTLVDSELGAVTGGKSLVVAGMAD
jgi:hypothetical protein